MAASTAKTRDRSAPLSGWTSPRLPTMGCDGKIRLAAIEERLSGTRQTPRVLSSVVGKGGNLAQAEQALICGNECKAEHFCCGR